jgi:hypothetical protein
MNRLKASMLGTGATGVLLISAAQLNDIRVEEKEVPQRNVNIQTTYRGEQRVIVQTDFKSQSTRSFLVNGKVVAAESDEDGDGFFETFTVFDPGTDDFEWFIRTPDGRIAPQTSEKLQELKAKKRDADLRLHEMLRTNPAPHGK